MDKAIGAGDGLRGQHEEEGRGPGDVSDGEDDAADEQGPGDGAAGGLDFVSHGGGGLDGAEGEKDVGPEDGVVERPVGDEAGGRDVEDNAETEPGDEGEQEEKGERDEDAECADVVEPLAGVDAEDVEQGD